MDLLARWPKYRRTTKTANKKKTEEKIIKSQIKLLAYKMRLAQDVRKNSCAEQIMSGF